MDKHCLTDIPASTLHVPAPRVKEAILPLPAACIPNFGILTGFGHFHQQNWGLQDVVIESLHGRDPPQGEAWGAVIQ
jgi:hypothetical protein